MYIRLQLNGAQVGKHLRVHGWVDLHIHPRSKVVIGNNCRINSGFANNAVGGYRRTGIWVGPDGNLVIAHNVGISNSTLVCTNSVTIEEGVFIGGDCNIYDTDFHAINSKARLNKVRASVKTAAVVLKRNCFIGAHTTILKGVTIGEAAVIGAGSMIVKSIPDEEIWAGNPARVIGKVTED